MFVALALLLWNVYFSSAIAGVTCDFPLRSGSVMSDSDDYAFLSGEIYFYTDPILGLDVEHFPAKLGSVNHQSWDGPNLVVEVSTGFGRNFQLVFLDDFSDLELFEYTSLGASRFETCSLPSTSHRRGTMFCQAQKALLISTACSVLDKN